jgi:hypothetical protein
LLLLMLLLLLLLLPRAAMAFEQQLEWPRLAPPASTAARECWAVSSEAPSW